MKFLQLDSPLMKVLGKIADLVIINLLTVLLCIPVITAGAAFTAMHYCCLKLIRNEEAGIAKQFFHSFKDNFKQSTIIWLIFLGIMGFFGVDLALMYMNPTEISQYILGGILVFIVLILFVGVFVYPIQAKFANPIPRTIKSAFVFSFRHFPKTLLILLAEVFPILLFFTPYIGFRINVGLMIFPLILCFLFTAPAYLAAYLYNKDFKKAEDKYLAEHPMEDPSANDEHIFRDELPEESKTEKK